jgi:hypothetical protein
MSSKIKTYSELMQYDTLVDRFRYLALRGRVGETTFGFDRWMNQKFYTSREWKLVRRHVIIRDEGRDLGIEGYEIHGGLTIHHLNPMTVADIRDGGPEILDPEFLITTTLPTHNAIHYSDERFLPGVLVERKRGDTKLW